MLFDLKVMNLGSEVLKLFNKSSALFFILLYSFESPFEV